MAEKMTHEKIRTPVFRAMFPSLFVPNEYKKRKSYQVEAVFDPDQMSETDRQLYATMFAVEKAVFYNLFKLSIEGASAPEYWRVFRSGNEPGRAKYPEYAGKIWAKLSSAYETKNGELRSPPGVVDAMRKPISPAHGNTDLIYPGCYMRATGIIIAFNDGAKGCKFVLNNLQKVADGPRLDGRIPAENDFDDVDPHYIGAISNDYIE